jgi:hypothetical protein
MKLAMLTAIILLLSLSPLISSSWNNFGGFAFCGYFSMSGRTLPMDWFGFGMKDRVYPDAGSERIEEGAVGLEDILLIMVMIDRGGGLNVNGWEFCVVGNCPFFSAILQTTSAISLYILK